MRSPFKTLPSFPDPLTELISILFSTTIFLTAGESVLFSIFGLFKSSSLTSSVRISGFSSCVSLLTSAFSSKIFGSCLDVSNLIILFSPETDSLFSCFVS